MASATTRIPRQEMYLSVLAGRAVTALASLAGDPQAWNERIEKGLQDGIAYCKAVRIRGGNILGRSPSEAWNHALKRSIEGSVEKSSLPADICEESEKIEQFLSQVATRKRIPQIEELVSAIEFLRKTATDR
jgi:hypothetical protein